jgi:hypothetical protein
MTDNNNRRVLAMALLVAILPGCVTQSTLSEDESDPLEGDQDPYTFTRETYRQRRLNDIYDGNPPLEAFEEGDEGEEGEEAADGSVLRIE